MMNPNDPNHLGGSIATAAAARPKAQPQALSIRKLRARIRMALIAQIIRESDSVPTDLRILAELRKRGVRASRKTVLNDLSALGLSREAAEVGVEF